MKFGPILLCGWMLLGGCATHQADQPSAEKSTPSQHTTQNLPQPTFAKDSYAIVASASVMQDAEWKAATVDVLLAKYPHAKVYTWSEKVEEVRGALSRTLPSFTAFVVKPEEAGVHLTIALHHLCRTLDDDPYGDTFWGVITGYDAPSAQLLAGAHPIAIRRALDCAGCDITAFQKAWRYTEDQRGVMNLWEKGATAEIEDVPCDTDNTRGVLERLQKDKVQFLATSGHATQRDWEMGFCGPNMTLYHKEGKLIAVNTKKQAYYAHSSEPKVYFATGNCLIGDIDQPDCMALSWMRDGGVRQMMGYTVTTWFGAQGWDTLKLFVTTAGLCTANEAFHFTNASIVHDLEALNIPETRAFRLRELQHVNVPSMGELDVWANQQLAKGKSLDEVKEAMKTISGNLHDRDTVCFYGDPALDARLAEERFSTTISEDEQKLTLTIHLYEGAQNGPLWVRLPESMEYNTYIASKELGQADIVLDNMIRFPNAEIESLTKPTTLTIEILK